MLAKMRFLTILVASTLIVAAAPSAQAGWITVKNDTKQVVVIQEVGGPLNRPLRGKCIKLQPGETYREYQLLAGTKNVVVYDTEPTAPPLLQDKLVWVKDDADYTIKSDGTSVKLVGGDPKAEPVKVKK